MKILPFNDKAADFLDRVGKGAFLTTAADGKINTMTIGWASLGMIWATPVLTAMVRPSRYTHELLDASMEFTVTLPYDDSSAALGICGSTSGRSGDKLAAAGLSTLPGQQTATPVIAVKGLHYECRVIMRQDIDPAGMNPACRDKWYAAGDFHTLYFAEIVACYETE